MKIKKIFHISDLHLFHSKNFHIHQYVFDKFYEDIEIEKPDLIVCTGDVIDSKIRLSPEQISLCQNFFLNITDYCPVILMMGNHDTILANKTRLDSLSAIIYPLYHTTKYPIHFLKHSDVYNLYDIDWAVWSCLDEQKNPFSITSKNENYTIGLFHGVVSGCESDNGMILTNGTELSEFEGTDIMMIGDIHKQQFFKNDTIGYAGSFLQTKQNENPSGSYLIWKWNGKTYKPTVKRIENIFSTLTFKIEDITSIPNFDIVKNINQVINLKYNPTFVSKVEVLKIKQELQAKYKNKIEIAPIVKKNIKKQEVEHTIETKTASLLELFKLYIEKNQSNLNLSDEDIEEIYLLDEKYSKLVDSTKDFEIGDFKLEQIVINNFLSYPPEDTIFQFNFNGLCSIIADNRSGKTNLISAIKFALFNTAPGSVNSLRKIINKHNKNKECYVQLFLSKNGKKYEIKRSLFPSKKEGVSIKLDFREVDENYDEVKDLKQEKRQDTEKELQKMFGIATFFEILSLSSAQKRQIEFIDCKNSERLTLVNKFLGVQEFEDKEKHVNDTLKTKKGAYDELLKDFKSIDLIQTEEELDDIINNIESIEQNIKDIENDLLIHEEDNKKLIKQYNEIKVLANKKVITPDDIKKENERIKALIISKKLEKNKSEKQINDLTESLENKKKEFFEKVGTDIKIYKPNHKVNSEFEKELAVNNADVKKLEKQLLIDICNNCGKDFTEKEKDKIKLKLNEYKEINVLLENNIKTNEKILNEYIFLQDTYNIIGRDLSNTQKTVLEIQNKISQLENDQEKLSSKIEEFEEVEKAQELLALLQINYDIYEKKKKQLNQQKIEYSVKFGSLKETKSNLEKDIKRYKTKFENLKLVENEMRLLKAYKIIIHKDGLPLFILKSKVDLINEQINLVVNQVFDYNVEFVIDEVAGDLDINFFYDEDTEQTDASLASGSETFIMNLCIKVGLAQISELPKITTLFIDEGFGTLDKYTIEKLPNLFTALNEYYYNIITISHLDELKDHSTTQIRLKKTGKYTEVF